MSKAEWAFTFVLLVGAGSVLALVLFEMAK